MTRPPPEPPPLSVDLRLEVPDTRPPLRRWLAPKVRQLAALAGVTGGSLAIVVVGDAQMSRLHARYKGVRGTTDVLTFDLQEKPSDALQGDLVICLDQANRQAKLRGHPARIEVLLYALHGILHLQGYNDVKPMQARKMHLKEDELLRRIGLAPVFHSSGQSTRNKPR